MKVNAAGGLDLYANQSSAVLTSAVWGDGFIDNPAEAGDPARRHGEIPSLFGAVPVSIRILYFARLREDMGIAEEMYDLPARRRDVSSLRAQLAARGGASATALGQGKAVRVSVNRISRAAIRRSRPGDEVAFFPPVTGG